MPIFISEAHVSGGLGLVKGFVNANVTGDIMWPMVPSWYPMMPYNHAPTRSADNATGCTAGVMCPWEPWSGHFELAKTVGCIETSNAEPCSMCLTSSA